MKIGESDFRRLHWKSRKLDEVCRLLWPTSDQDAPAIGDQRMVDAIADAIGEYRPGPLRTVHQFIDGEKVSR